MDHDLRNELSSAQAEEVAIFFESVNSEGHPTPLSGRPQLFVRLAKRLQNASHTLVDVVPCHPISFRHYRRRLREAGESRLPICLPWRVDEMPGLVDEMHMD